MELEALDSQSPWADDYLITITRPSYERDAFDAAYKKTLPPQPPWRDRLQGYVRKLKAENTCSRRCLLQAVKKRLPIIGTLQSYSFREKLLSDAVAGLSVGIMHIPQGMGFALLASLPPVYGIYASFWPVLIYFFLGTCHHLSVGTMALISLMVSAVVEREVLALGLSPEVSQSPLHPLSGYNDTYHVYNSSSDILQTQDNLTMTVLDFNFSMPHNVSFNGTLIQRPLDVTAVKVRVAMAISFLVGIIQMLMGFFKMGIVTIFMPSPFVGGFTTGAACHIATSQMKFLFGMKNRRFNGMFELIKNWIDILKSLPTSNPAEIVISVLCITTLLVIKLQINERFRSRMKAPVPAELIVVIIGCVVSYTANISDKFNVKIIGHIPIGIPEPTMPPMDKSSTYIVDALMIAVISFAISYSIGSIFAQKHKYSIEPNQELYAYGMLHIIGSFFGSFVGAGAPPRCVVIDVSRGSSQVAAIFTSLLLLLVILVMGPLFQPLPNSILASIIFVALIPMFQQFQNLRPLWRVNKWDFAIWLVTWASVTFLNVTTGLVIGIGFSVLTIILQSLLSQGFVLGAVEKTELYVPVKFYDKTTQVDGILIFKFEATLHFASRRRFKTELFKAVFKKDDDIGDDKLYLGDDVENNNESNDNMSDSPGPTDLLVGQDSSHQTATPSKQRESNTHENQPNETNATGSELRQRSVGSKESLKDGTNEVSLPITPSQSIAESLGALADGGLHPPECIHVILDCSCVTYVDMMGLNTLKEVQVELRNVGLTLALASCPVTFLRSLNTTGYVWSDGTTMDIFPTVLDAVMVAKRRQAEAGEKNEKSNGHLGAE